jgi:MFS family permease
MIRWHAKHARLSHFKNVGISIIHYSEATYVSRIMSMTQRSLSTSAIASVGLAGLAAAMGIGRFAFTPVFPLMQEHFGTSLGEGAWLATANYIGYFVGALGSLILTPPASRSVRWGLLAVAVSTLAMGITHSFAAWCVLRLIAGVASAFVLVGASAWALPHLTVRGRADLTGWAFAGVGFGICIAGLVTLVAASWGMGPELIWLALGTIATAVAAYVWRAVGIEAPAGVAPQPTRAPPLDRDSWILIGCYGAFGFGYIIPATFLPAVARSLVPDPAVFGWTWPLFGLAAALSTIAVSTVMRAVAPRKVAAWSLVVMAAGVLLPVLHGSLVSLAASAVCVGGTFMVMTMAGLQEARRVARGAATRLMSALTAAFAIGQFAGPILVSAGKSPAQALITPSLCAVALLVVSAGVLLLRQQYSTVKT